MEENKIVNETAEVTETADKKFCTSCGAELHPEAVMCPACGTAQETTTEAKENELKGFKKFIHRFKTDKKLWAICGGILAVIAIAVVVSILAYRSSLKYYFNKVNEACPGADCGWDADDKCIVIDTNFYDIHPDDMNTTQYYVYTSGLYDTLDAIEFLNAELGFSSSVYDDMMETTSLMGRQSVSNGKYRITWTFHPDEGLEVRYEKN